MPVMLNNNMPSKHSAELIQCHRCRVFNQPARRDSVAVAEVVSDMRAIIQAGCRSGTGDGDQVVRAMMATTTTSQIEIVLIMTQNFRGTRSAMGGHK